MDVSFINIHQFTASTICKIKYIQMSTARHQNTLEQTCIIHTFQFNFFFLINEKENKCSRNSFKCLCSHANQNCDVPETFKNMTKNVSACTQLHFCQAIQGNMPYATRADSFFNESHIPPPPMQKVLHSTVSVPLHHNVYSKQTLTQHASLFFIYLLSHLF